MKKKNNEELFFGGFPIWHFFIDEKQNKSYRQKSGTNIPSVYPFIKLLNCHRDLLSRAIARYKNSIVPTILAVKSSNGLGKKRATKNAAETFVEKEEYILKACFALRESFMY